MMNHPVFKSEITAIEEALALLQSAGMLNKEQVGQFIFDPREIRRAIKGRRLRDLYFGAGLFEEPAWDIILDLFAAELESRRVSVSSACTASATAPTTALRWIGRLVDSGLIERTPDDFDRRRSFLSLSEQTSRKTRQYIAAMRQAGIALS